MGYGRRGGAAIFPIRLPHLASTLLLRSSPAPRPPALPSSSSSGARISNGPFSTINRHSCPHGIVPPTWPGGALKYTLMNYEVH